MPATWPGYAIDYRFRGTLYRIAIEQVDGALLTVALDGVLQPGNALPLADDGSPHDVQVRLGRSWTAARPALAEPAAI